MKLLAALYALFGAMFVTVGIGNSESSGLLSALLVAAGLLLLSASLILWTRR